MIIKNWSIIIIKWGRKSRTLLPDELAIELKNYLNTGIESKILKEHRSAMLL